MGGTQLVDNVDSVGKENRMAVQAGSIAQGGGQVGFAQTNGTQEDNVGVLFEELQPKEILHRQPVDFLGPVPVKLFEGVDDREVRGFDAQLDGMLAALLVLLVDEARQVIDVGPGLLRSLLS